MSTATEQFTRGSRSRTVRRVLLGVALSMGLGGCVDRDMSDLQRYVEDVLGRQAPVIAPLPQIKPYEIYTYQSSEAKDPFQPFFTPEDVTESATGPTNCPGPDPDRVREELESYPLDSLRMVGTIERDEELFGVILSTDGSIHRVTVDNYLGRNHGRIIDIREEQIDLIEIVPDGQGCFVERETSLALIEE